MRILFFSTPQCNFDYPDPFGQDKTVQISYTLDEQDRFIHNGRDMKLLPLLGNKSPDKQSCTVIDKQNLFPIRSTQRWS